MIFRIFRIPFKKDFMVIESHSVFTHLIHEIYLKFLKYKNIY
jgi:hypothetical protein